MSATDKGVPVVLIKPTTYGKFIVVNEDETRVWDVDHWRAFGGGEIFSTYPAAIQGRRKALAHSDGGAE